MQGKELRMNRFRYHGSQGGIIVPLDHGLTMGPIDGIKSVGEIARWIGHPSICGVIAHKGLAERLAKARLLDGLGLMIHLNGMSREASAPDTKVMLTSVEAAAKLGADGVSVQINFDGENDPHNLSLLGKVVDEANDAGLPVLAMVYDKVVAKEMGKEVDRLRHIIRIAIELGVAGVKLGPSDEVPLPELLRDLSQDVSIYLAGGKLNDENAFVEKVQEGLLAGAEGLCVGRNVFQRSNASNLLFRLEDLLKGANGRVNGKAARPALVGYGLH